MKSIIEEHRRRLLDLVQEDFSPRYEAMQQRIDGEEDYFVSQQLRRELQEEVEYHEQIESMLDYLIFLEVRAADAAAKKAEATPC